MMSNGWMSDDKMCDDKLIDDWMSDDWMSDGQMSEQGTARRSNHPVRHSSAHGIALRDACVLD
jgi:hypothetical protein